MTDNKVNEVVQLDVTDKDGDIVTIDFELTVENNTLNLTPVDGWSSLQDIAPDGLVFEFFNEQLNIQAFT